VKKTILIVSENDLMCLVFQTLFTGREDLCIRSVVDISKTIKEFSTSNAGEDLVVIDEKIALNCGLLKYDPRPPILLVAPFVTSEERVKYNKMGVDKIYDPFEERFYPRTLIFKLVTQLVGTYEEHPKGSTQQKI